MSHCPICKTESIGKYGTTPYWQCGNCACWWQDPMPAKTYIADFEGDPTVMSEADRQVNRELAGRLFRNVMGGKPGKTLDIGCKLPVLAEAFYDLGCEARACDPAIPEGHYKCAVHRVDIEKDDDWKWQHSFGKYALVTLVHVWEHLYDPLRAISRIRSIVADDGALFIRMPDHTVTGYERDLTPHHASIHPFYHSIISLLQCCVETKDTFAITDSWPLEGVGQRDIVLRPIKKAPTIALGGIVKNEMRDLPRMVKSVETCVDKHILIDTGSTDGTEKFCREIYTKANDSEGRLTNFSEARNRYLDLGDNEAEWLLTLDADDELKTPAAIRRASYWRQFGAFALWIQDGESRWLTHRLFKTNQGIRFEGRAHEYPMKPEGVTDAVLPDTLIIHHGGAAPGQENSNDRNLRILMLEWEEKPSARCAFYIANTHRDAKRWKEAVFWYQKRMAMGEHYRDEWLFAHLYCARALMELKEYELAAEGFREALKSAPDWCEFRMGLADIAYKQGNYSQAIAHATECVNKPIPHTNLWREPGAYRDQPARLISWCYEHMGDIGMASAWSSIAWSLIGKPDPDWEARGQQLALRVVAATKPQAQKRIALHRPGAIGDILMTLNLIPALKAKYPDHIIEYWCSPAYANEDQLGNIIKAAGVDEVHTGMLVSGDYEKGKFFNLIGYPLHENYPQVPMRRHLIDYFAEEMGIDIEPFSDESWKNLPRVNLPKPPAPFTTGGYATLQRHAGWSAYKQWFDDRWDDVVRQLNAAGIPIVEIDEKKGLPLSTVIALIANAKMHIGVDSFGNHLTHIFQVPGVILWGSTQWTAAGYPHNINLSKGPDCQPCFRETHPNSLHPRGPCVRMIDGQHACMRAITVDEVVEACLRAWRRVGRNGAEGEVGSDGIARDDTDRVDAGDGRHASS